MRKLDISNYVNTVSTPEGNKDIEVETKQVISEVLFHPDLKMGARDIISMNKIMQKIENSDKEVLLEEQEYHKIREAFEEVRGFNRLHVELVERILDSPVIEVEEKKGD